MNFSVAYDKVMAKWPADREEISVRTAFGETVVNVCGPRDGTPLLLLPGGGGATSASWFANAAELARTHRVHAVDLIGEPGRSVRDAESPLRTVEHLTAWLDELIGALLHDMGADPGRPDPPGRALVRRLDRPAVRAARAGAGEPSVPPRPDEVLLRVQDGVPAACRVDDAAALAPPSARLPGVGDRGSPARPRLAASPGGGRRLPARAAGDGPGPRAGCPARARPAGPGPAGREEQDP